MDVLIRAALGAILAGCYTPVVGDCTVTCSGSAACADGQHCVSGFCVARDVTQACSTDEAVDAPSGHAIDAAPPAMTEVRIVFAGHGHVEFDGQTVCGGAMIDHDTCMVAERLGATVHAVAVPTDAGGFVNWTDGPCMPSPVATCTFEVVPALTIGAKFK